MSKTKEMININALKTKALFYLERKVTVHIKLKRKLSDGRRQFYNGLITETGFKGKEDFLVINDRIYGQTPLRFEDIFDIIVFQEGRR